MIRLAVLGNVLLLLFCILLGEYSAQNASAPLKSRLLTEGQRGWELLQAKAKHMQCVIKETQSVYDRENTLTKKPSETRWEFEVQWRLVSL